MRTSEQEWLIYLKNKDLLKPSLKKTIILSPHPDDETLGAGGLIYDLRKNKIEVSVITVTDGENAYHEVENLGAIRKKEQEKALEKLGVSPDKIIRLQLPDSKVNDESKKLEQLILPFISNGVHLLAPWVGDYHPDHEAVGRVAVNIAQQKKAQLSFYFFWTWHYACVKTLNKLPLCIYPLSPETSIYKQQAIKCYKSQLSYTYGPPILPENILTPAKRNFEVYFPYEH